MIDIYKDLGRDFDIDGFRIDTMKHVNDEFWQEFGPDVLRLRRGRRQATTSSCSARCSRRQRRRRQELHLALHDPRQDAGVLDFPFQDAARDFASRGHGNAKRPGDVLRERRLVHRRATPTSTQLPTFLGNHDMGRIGQLHRGRQPRGRRRRAARPRPARPRADVLLPRQPGRLLRRRAGLHRRRAATRSRGRRCSRARSRTTSTTTRSAPTPTHADDNFVTGPPAVCRHQRPRRADGGAPGAARTAPSRTATPRTEPGVFAFSRIDRQRPARVRRRRSTTANSPDGRRADVMSASGRSTGCTGTPRRNPGRTRTASSP